MAVFLTSNNIKDYVGRHVFDTSIQNDYGLGTIVSTFEISGEIGVRVAYSLDRLVANDKNTMEGLIVNDPVSGQLNSGEYPGTVSGMPGTGSAYIRYDEMSDNYVAANPTDRGGTFRGMNYSPADRAGSFTDVGVFGTAEQRLVRKVYFDETVSYYPENASIVSGLPSIFSLRVI